MTHLTVTELADAAGMELGTSRWVLVDQHRIDGFAADTEDDQWIHAEPDRAAGGPFGSTIAHGYLTLSITGALVSELLAVSDASAVINYGLDRVRFPAAVPAGTRIRTTGRIARVTALPGGQQVAIALTTEAEGLGKPVCLAEVLVRYVY